MPKTAQFDRQGQRGHSFSPKPFDFAGVARALLKVLQDSKDELLLFEYRPLSQDLFS